MYDTAPCRCISVVYVNKSHGSHGITTLAISYTLVVDGVESGLIASASLLCH